MSNAQVKAIRDEIERMLTFDGSVSTSYYIGKRDAERELKAFIDSLPDEVDESTKRLNENWMKQYFDEQPAEGLEEAADKYSNENEYMDVGFCVEPVYIGHKTEKAFIAGAEWQKSQMPMPEDTVIFQKGIEEGKRLMMEEAVEGTYDTADWGVPCIDLNAPLDLERFDKVKIIIVKED